MYDSFTDRLTMPAMLVLLLGSLIPGFTHADVVSAGDAGFQIRIERQVKLTKAETVFETLIKEVGTWWNPSHTWTMDASNLAFDMDRHALMETLPDGGFVRHMDVVFFRPGHSVRLRGGLGPLQEMGLTGALTIATVETDGDVTVTLTYNVSGHLPGGFQGLAPAVDGVLAEQMDRLKRYCETGSPDVAPDRADK